MNGQDVVRAAGGEAMSERMTEERLTEVELLFMDACPRPRLWLCTAEVREGTPGTWPPRVDVINLATSPEPGRYIIPIVRPMRVNEEVV